MSYVITFVVSDITATGGIERVITHLASELSEKDFRIQIISLHKSTSDISYPLSKAVSVKYVDDVNYISGEPGSIKRMLKHFRSAFKANLMVLKNKNSTFVVNTLPMAVILSFSLVFVKRKYVVEHVHYYYYNKTVLLLRKYLYKLFNKVIVLTDRDRNVYLKNKISSVTIPNPLSFKPKGFNDPGITKKRIIAVGRLEYQKGFDILIKAFSLLSADEKNGWSLDIYGEGTLYSKLQSQINSSGLSSQISLLGNVGDLEKLYKSYDFFVFTSRFEGFGMVLLEAMSCGLPCISFDCPTGPREILDDGKYGILCSNGDAEELRIKMVSLMANANLREEYSRLSLQRSQVYSIENILDAWKLILKSDLED